MTDYFPTRVTRDNRDQLSALDLHTGVERTPPGHIAVAVDLQKAAGDAAAWSLAGIDDILVRGAGAAGASSTAGGETASAITPKRAAGSTPTHQSSGRQATVRLTIGFARLSRGRKNANSQAAESNFDI